MHFLLVKPYPDAEFLNFMDRKKQGTRGKKIQERMESSIKGFYDALTGNSDNWMKSRKWPGVLTLHNNLHRSVNSYYSRIFNKSTRHVGLHNSNEPVRSASDAVNYKTVERPLNTLTVHKEARGLNSLLLALDTYVPIDVNIFMEGLQTMGM